MTEMNAGTNPSQVIPIEVSARHVHLTKADFEMLFGVGAELHVAKELSQPGQFAAVETVGVVGARGEFERVRIVGPLRAYTQAELAWTDALHLGVRPPVRMSGDLRDAASVTLRGPVGMVSDRACAIVAKRHIHINPAQAASLGVTQGALVAVHVPGERGAVFDQVIVRIDAQFDLRLHLDTDEGNACGASAAMAAGSGEALEAYLA